jgi:hypothetical protein
MAPTLPTTCGSLPPEGAAAPADWLSQIRSPGLNEMRPPRSFASCNSLPPEGAYFPWGGPAGNHLAPTLPTARGSLPPEGACP